MSQRTGHCEEIARDAVRAGYETIVAAGGDGTIGEVINGMIASAGLESLPRFGVIPIGTANDLAANLGLKTSLEDSVKRLTGEHISQVDICMVNGRYFVNNAGLGLEPYITTLQQRMTRVTGIFRYLLATLVGIAHNPQWSMSMEWDGGAYDGPVTLASIGNGARTGGLFFTVPSADPKDGRLSFVHASITTRIGIMRALPMILRSGQGNIAEHPRVAEHHATRLVVRANRPTPIHADGELFPEWATDFHFSVYPGKLPLLVD